MTSNTISNVPSDPASLEKELASAFEGGFKAVPTNFLYKVGMFFVALSMVILPLIYLAMVAAIGYALMYHVVNDVGIFKSIAEGKIHGRGSLMMVLLVYFGPIVIGLIGIFFMIKPLFAGSPPPPPTFKLDPKKEPLLFKFVEYLCKVIHAPVPSEIMVDMQVNASARFRRGMWSFFSNDLVLTIGLPLVAG